MDTQIPNWFQKRYEDQVQHRAQQRQRRLAGTVAGGGMFNGDTVYFPRMGAVEMYDSARFAQIALANAAMDMISLQAKPKFVLLGIWDPDKSKLNIGVADEYAKATTNAGFRAEDRLIRDALVAAKTNGVVNTAGAAEPIKVIGDYNTVADLDAIAEGVSYLGTQEMFEGEEITCALPFKLKTQYALDPYMAKSDTNKENLPWNDVAWRTYERFSGNGDNGSGALEDNATGVDFFMYARSAIVSGQNDEMKLINGRIDGALTDVIGKWFQAGAVAREPKGIVCIKSKLNFALSRKAIPVIGVN